MSGQYGALYTRYMDDPNTFVGINLLLDYRENKRRKVVAPDVFVVFGVPDKARRSYRVWEEGKVPDFVLEVASKGTYEKDLGSKKGTYERMGVREYCVFDPAGGMHRPRLQLFRHEGGVYKRVNWRGDPDGPLAVMSETLGMELRFEDDRMRSWVQRFGNICWNITKSELDASRQTLSALQPSNSRATSNPKWQISRNGFGENLAARLHEGPSNRVAVGELGWPTNFGRESHSKVETLVGLD